MSTTTPVAVPVRDLVAPVYRSFAARPALIDGAGTVTFEELGRRALRVANGLRTMGVAGGDRVVIVSDNSVEWVVLEHALYLGGFVRVAALTRLHPRELSRLVEDAGAVVVAADPVWLASVGRAWLPDCVQHVVLLGHGAGADGDQTLAEVAHLGGDAEFPPVDETALSWISYTSGSTGLPKGVTYTQRSLGAMLRNIGQELGQVVAGDVALHSAPLSHFSGAIALQVTIAGGANLIHKSFDVEAVIAAIEQDGVTILPLVPTQITMLIDALRARIASGSPVDLSSIRLLPYAGSAIAPDRLAVAVELFGPALMQFYGAQEAPMPLTCLRPEDHVDAARDGGLARLASAGRRTAHVEMRIVDAAGVLAGPGEVGEICARGEQVTQGYWNNPEGTREVLGADGWLRTGDVGYFDGEGFLFIVDRKKDMVVTGGFNVFPREVENVISSLDGVQEVAVVGAPSERWGEEVAAVISVAPGRSLTEQEVMAHCRAHIAGFKVPKRVLFVDQLPKTGTGKIYKLDIRADLWRDHDRKI